MYFPRIQSWHKHVLCLTLNYSIKFNISYFPQINWQTHITSSTTDHTLQGLNKHEISITFHIFLGNFRGRVNRKRMCRSHNLWTVYPEVDFCIFCWYLEHVCASNMPQQFAHLQQKTQTHTHNVSTSAFCITVVFCESHISLICDKSVTTQNLAFLSYWYKKKHLQMHL